MRTVEYIREVIRDLDRVQGLPNAIPDSDDIDGLLDAGAAGGIFISKSVGQSIAGFAGVIREQDASIQRRFTVKEWNSVVRRAFGPALAQVDLGSDAAAELVEALVRDGIGRLVGSYGWREYITGCTLLHSHEIDPVIIGPVQLESRESWLARVISEGVINSGIAAAVSNSWAGGTTAFDEYSTMFAQKVVQAVGECPYICTVRTHELPPETGAERAMLAARLGLAGIALMWSVPSKVLDGVMLQVDRNTSLKHLVSLEEGGKLTVSMGARHAPYALNVSSAEWRTKIERLAPILAAVGEIAEYVIHVNGRVNRPNICHVLMQALLWFHEACREPIDAMAIVKFTITLDALAGGKGEASIRRLLSNRVGWREDSPIYKDRELTMKHAVAQVYKEGRSRTVHGTSARILMDHSEMRKLAEVLAANALFGCLLWMARNAGEDSPALLVSAER